MTECNTAFARNYSSGRQLDDGRIERRGLPGRSGIDAQDALGNFRCRRSATSRSNLKNPKYVEWNFEVQRTFGSQTVVSANYVGNRGYDGLIFNNDLNGFGFGELPTTAPDPRVAQRKLPHQQWRLELQRYDAVGAGKQLARNHGAIELHLLARARRYLERRRVAVQRDHERSVRKSIHSTCMTTTHLATMMRGMRLTASYIYQLPFKSENRMLNAAIGGWQLSGTMFYHTGFPFSIIDGGTSALLAGNNLAGSTILLQPTGLSPRGISRTWLAASWRHAGDLEPRTRSHRPRHLSGPSAATHSVDRASWAAT